MNLYARLFGMRSFVVRTLLYSMTIVRVSITLSLRFLVDTLLLGTLLARVFFYLFFGEMLTSRLRMSYHITPSFGTLLLLCYVDVFRIHLHERSTIILIIRKQHILCIYLVFRILT